MCTLNVFTESFIYASKHILNIFKNFSSFDSSILYNNACVPSDKPMGIPGEPLDKELTIRYTYSVKWTVSEIEFLIFMPPTLKKWGAYWFQLVRSFVRPSVRSKKFQARVLKFHIWIPRQKIAYPYFFSCLNYLPLPSYAPFKG